MIKHLSILILVFLFAWQPISVKAESNSYYQKSKPKKSIYFEVGNKISKNNQGTNNLFQKQLKPTKSSRERLLYLLNQGSISIDSKQYRKAFSYYMQAIRINDKLAFNYILKDLISRNPLIFFLFLLAIYCSLIIINQIVDVILVCFRILKKRKNHRSYEFRKKFELGIVKQKLVRKINKGAEVWNRWRKKNTSIKLDLSDINLARANLENINLARANLKNVNLARANLSGAYSVVTCFTHANLSNANLENANLSRSNLEGADLLDTRLKDINFSGAYLKDANLENTNLLNANLENTNFSNANLENANLKKVQALFTNFTGATLTGACIEDWNINSKTNLENVNCDYIYFRVIASNE